MGTLSAKTRTFSDDGDQRPPAYLREETMNGNISQLNSTELNFHKNLENAIQFQEYLIYACDIELSIFLVIFCFGILVLVWMCVCVYVFVFVYIYIYIVRLGVFICRFIHL